MDLVRRLLQEPALDAAEERRLASLALAGDRAARDALLRASLRLVAMRVRAMGFASRDVDDAFQVGVVALMAAVARFDPDRGARLATYAWPWVTRALEEHRRPCREVPHAEVGDVVPGPPTPAAPAAVDDLSVLSSREREVVVARFSRTPDGRCPTPWSEVARELGLGVSTVRRLGDRAVSRLRREVGTVGDRAPRVGADPP
jgi:DNA-directed RNA polymerase specialized sigma subunit